MDRWTRIPLAERLQCAGTAAPNFLGAFELFVSDFYEGLAEITLDPHFRAVYDTCISPYSYRDKDGRSMELLLSEVVAVAAELPQAERAGVLYQLLIEPFARLYDCERREQKV